MNPPRIALLIACWAATPGAWALGPTAPFVPPGKEAAGGPALGVESGNHASSGLSGVRLGRLAGALIDGGWVAQGGQVRGARLESVRRDRVVLRHADGSTETLSLYSATAVPAASAATPGAASAPTATAER